MWMTLFCMTLAAWQPVSRALPEEYVGSTPGTFKVLDDGSATYTLSLRLPPGAGGYVPHLSLGFSSGRGSAGAMGVGFHIKGLTHITRCPSTIAQHNVTRGVQYTSMDRFCLGGELLVARNGIYGANGTTYSTEVDDFSRIISFGSPNPQRFELRTRTGEVLIFGGTPDSLVLAHPAGVVTTWAMSERRQPCGNYIRYHYIQPFLGAFGTSTILYTGNGAVEPTSRVDFVYETRPDHPNLYVAGSLLTTPGRISRIETYSNTTLVTQYKVAYEQSCLNDKSRINTIQECDGANACLPPTRFNWSETCDGKFDTTVSGPPIKISPYLTQAGIDVARTHVADFTGDGLPDILYVNGGNIHKLVASTLYINLGNFSFSESSGPTFSITTTNTALDLSRIKIVDLNGDGVSDILVLRSDATSDIFISSASSVPFASAALPGPKITISTDPSTAQLDLSRIGFGDFNGDGLVDIHVLEGWGTAAVAGTFFMNSRSLTFTQLAAPPLTNIRGSLELAGIDIGRVRIADLNGDKLADFYVVTGWGLPTTDRVFINHGPGLNGSTITFGGSIVGPTTFMHGTVSEAKNDLARIQLTDIQGDGAIDIYMITATGQPSADVIFLGFGNGTFDKGTTIHGPTTIVNSGRSDEAAVDINRIRLSDMNGDGMVDVFCAKCDATNSFLIFFGSGSGFSAGVPGPSWTLSSAVSQAQVDLQRIQLGDLTGDGQIDLLEYRYEQGSPSQSVLHMSPISNAALVSITDGFNATVNIKYAPLTDKSVHNRSSAPCGFPLHCVPSASRVVSMITKSNGGAADQHVTYQYIGRKTQSQGLGDLGFASTRSTHTEAGLVFETVHSQDWTTRLQHRVISTSHKTTTGVVLKMKQMTHSVVSSQCSACAVAFNITVPFEEEVNFDLSDGRWMKNITLTRLFDVFNNLVLSRRTVIGPTVMHTSTTRNTYVNVVKTWMIGMRTGSATTTQTGTKPPLTTSMEWVHDNITGLIITTVNEPLAQNNTFSTSYKHDQFGNAVAVTVSAQGLLPRTDTAVYDASGRFVIERANSLGHTRRYTYDQRFGHPVTSTDANNLTVIFEFDGLGRTKITREPDGSTSTVAHEWVSCPERQDCVFAEITVDSCGTNSTTIHDSAGRTIRRLHWGIQDGVPKQIVRDSYFNALGKICLVTEPQFVSSEQRQPLNTTFKYDCLGRLLEKTFSDGTSEIRQYDGYFESVKNRGGQISTRSTNALGLTMFSTDNANGTVRFVYDSLGRCISTLDPDNNSIVKAYDISGNAISSTDPDLGDVTFEYDRLGQRTHQTDSSGRDWAYSHDVLGRIVAVTAADGSQHTFQYDVGDHAVGMMVWANTSQATKQYFYDNLSRPVMSEILLFGKVYRITTQFDSCSRPASVVNPSGFNVTNRYTVGLLTEAHSPMFTSVDHMFTLDSLTPYGQVQQHTFGNNLVNRREYNPISQQLENIRTFKEPDGVADWLQYVNYTTDRLGNVISRREESRRLTETFEYDDLNRITVAQSCFNTINDHCEKSTTSNITYDTVGNIMTKAHSSGPTVVYKYGTGSQGPHAVTSVSGLGPGTTQFAYDGAGRMVQGNNRNFTYDFFGRVVRVDTLQSSIEFIYDPAGKVIAWRDHKPNGVVRTTVTVGSLTEITEGATHVCRHTVHNLVVLTGNCSTNFTDLVPRYISRDRQGSVDTITDQNAEVLEKVSFGAWGERRNSTTWQPLGKDDASSIDWSNDVTDRGYTGHLELYDAGQLVHMGARIYDPTLSRFISPDPTVQAPHYLQSYNRYSYVINNPTALTDPTGLSWLSRSQFYPGLPSLVYNARGRSVAGSFDSRRRWKLAGCTDCCRRVNCRI